MNSDEARLTPEDALNEGFIIDHREAYAVLVPDDDQETHVDCEDLSDAREVQRSQGGVIISQTVVRVGSAWRELADEVTA